MDLINTFQKNDNKSEIKLFKSAESKGRLSSHESCVTVLLPVYNEAAQISKTLESIQEFSRQSSDFVFCFINDGSTDNTESLLKRAVSNDKSGKLALISYPKNAGKGYAVRVGVFYAQSQYIIFTDGDLAYSLDHLQLFLEKLKECDVVIGSRRILPEKQKNLRFVRKAMGEVFNRMARIILNLPYKDTQAGLKGFRLACAKEIFSIQLLDDFSFDAEIIFIAKKSGFKIAEIPARVSEHHSYKVSKIKMFTDPLKMFMDLIKIRFNGIMGKYNRK